MRHNQNRRSRGRSRKGPNPLTRSYESNGPDVKVRGTAAHVAEKYMTLARDAISSGDSVSAENYLQHAEHYNRIVMAAQAQFQPQQPQFREGGEEGYDDERQNGRAREFNGDGRGDGDDESFEGADGDEERGNRQARRPDDRGRQRGQRGGGRRDERERPESPERAASQEAADPAAGPQPDVVAAEEPAAEEAAAPPRRRRRAPKKESETAEAAEDSTKDGAAALAAFPD